MASHDFPVVNADNPWLGLAPYTEGTRRFFFGRDAEIRELFLRVRDNTLTVLFGMSGLGKTSLLGAGLVPKLRAEKFQPALLRLRYEQAPSPVVQIKTALASACVAEGENGASLLAQWEGLTLWELFHDTRLRGTSAVPAERVVLIFDQFEEAFTLGQSKQRHHELEELFTQLADLVENRPPANVQQRLDADPTAALQYDFAPSHARVVITLREDYLSLLEARKCLLPSLMRNRMALHELAGPEAKAVVMGPAHLDGRSLVSDAVAESIVCIVAKRDVGTPMAEIKAVPPLLSLMCEQLNLARGAAQQITADLVLERHENILDVFYRDSFLDTRGKPVPPAVQHYVEDTLVTDKGFRRTEPREEAESALSRLGVLDSVAAIQRLIDRRLLTTEERGGIPMVEITHDRLVPFVLKSRNERHEREAKMLAERQRRRIEKAETLMKFILEELAPQVERTQRTQLFEAVQDYYRHLEGWESDAVESRSNQAALFKLMGKAKQHDGDLQGSRELYRAALEIYQQIGAAGGSSNDAAAEVDRLLAQVREQVRTEQASSSYDIYISYSRRDNVPGQGTDSRGWITAIRDQIVEDHRRFSTEPLRILFDQGDIHGMDDWRHRILAGLRSSRILLVFLSPNYFASEFCRWEWEEHTRRSVHQSMGGETVLPVYLIEVPGIDEPTIARWLNDVMRFNFTDLRPWFPKGVEALREKEVRHRLARLGDAVWDRLAQARLVEAVPGNLRRENPNFVGRQEELRKLHEQLSLGSVGVVTALHGLGGVGKTELAIAYAHGFADRYPAGLWRLSGEGKTELLPLIGELAWEPAFGLSPTELERNAPELLGRRVLDHLKQRAEAMKARDPDQGGACLLLLDNITEPSLLSGTQLSTLPKSPWLRIVATTRLNVSAQGNSLTVLALDSLDEDSALSLIRDLQPPRDARREIVTDIRQGRPEFISEAEEAAAREIVRSLGGFPLAVEQIAHYLGYHPEVLPSDILTTMRQKSLTSVDTIPQRDADVSAQMYARNKQLGLILDTTLAGLDAPARTALQIASLLPPDTVPWPWLRSLTAAQHPEVGERERFGTDRWLIIQRHLTNIRLLTLGDDPEIGRIHSLVAAHLAESIEAETRETLDQWIELRADAVALSSVAPVDWELDALCAALPHILSDRPSRGLAASAANLSERMLVYRSVSAATALLSSAHSVLERLAANNPDGAEGQRDLSVSFIMLGNLATSQGNLPEAQRLFGESLRIRQRLAESDPTNAAWQRDLSVSLNNLGDLATAQGNLPDAQRLFGEALRILQRLAESDPANAAWERDLSVSFNKLGDLATSQGNLPEAQRLFGEALRITQRLAESDPANAEWQRDLSVTLNRIADIALAQGDVRVAQQQLFRAKEIAERIAASDPANAIWHRDVMVSLAKLGDVASMVGNPREAQQLFGEALRIAQGLAESDPANAAWQRDLSVSFNKLGDLATSQGNLPEAQRLFGEALRITQRLAESDPASAAWQRDLAVNFNRLGRIMQESGDTAAATRLLEDSLRIKQRLAESDPANAQWQRDLVVTHYQMAGLAQTQQNEEKLIGHLTRTLQILNEMLQRGLQLDPQMAELHDQLTRVIGT